MPIIYDDEDTPDFGQLREVGPRPTHQNYSDEFKAAALADVELLGPGATAAKYGINQKQLYTWRKRFDTDHLLETRKGRIADLVIRYLEANLQALTAQAYVSSDPEYIRSQRAGELAVLHGIMADKSLRLLEALQAGAERDAAAQANKPEQLY